MLYESMIIIIIANFYTRFSHKAQSALQHIITPVIGYISMPLLQCTISTPRGAFLAWYSSAVIMALANSNTIICHILPGPHLYTWVESSNVDYTNLAPDFELVIFFLFFYSNTIFTQNVVINLYNVHIINVMTF